MTKLFISHASEDKDAIAQPLADELKKDHDIWFDKYSLHVGDSLREKIDEGLRNCDFGIVILSPHFFEKKWPGAELNGLFALEEKNRKVILPVWHNVTVAEVRKFSPMLSDRLGADSGKGVQVAAEELRAAISASDRTREITSKSPGSRMLQKFCRDKSEDDHEQRVLSSEEGASAVLEGVKSLFKAVERGIDSADGSRRFHFAGVTGPAAATGLAMDGPNSIRATLHLHGLYSNSAPARS